MRITKASQLSFAAHTTKSSQLPVQRAPQKHCSSYHLKCAPQKHRNSFLLQYKPLKSIAAATICSAHHKSIVAATIWNSHHKSIAAAIICNAHHKSIAAATICHTHHNSIAAPRLSAPAPDLGMYASQHHVSLHLLLTLVRIHLPYHCYMSFSAQTQTYKYMTSIQYCCATTIL